MCDATHNESFGSRLTAINKVRKHIDDILDNIFVFFCRCLSNLRIEALTGYGNITR